MSYYSGLEAPSLGFGSVLLVRVARVSAHALCEQRTRKDIMVCLAAADLCPLVVLFCWFALASLLHTIYTHFRAFKVTVDKSGSTMKHEFGGCGTRNYELERVDVLNWLFYFCTINHEFGGCGQGITIFGNLSRCPLVVLFLHNQERIWRLSNKEIRVGKN